MLDKNTVIVKIRGKEFPIKSLESEDYVNSVASFVDKQLDYISKRNDTLSSDMVAVLACINLADEMSKAQKKAESLDVELKQVKEELGIVNTNLKNSFEEVTSLREKFAEQQFEMIKLKAELNEYVKGNK